MLALALMIGACGGNNSDQPGPDGGGNNTDPLPDDGPCVPDALRCNGDKAQKCNADGTRWETVEECTTFCQDGLCALDGLDVTSDMTLEGSILVAGAVTVRSGATLSSMTGNLTITADEITVEGGGSIAMAPTGNSPDGKGNDISTSCPQCTPGGGGYGTVRVWGSDTDSDVQAGSPGGRMGIFMPPDAALGGGVVKLLATKIVIAGQITANGANGGSSQSCAVGGGGGSGGGVLLAADDITVTGSISAAGGLGGPTNPNCGFSPFGGAGGDGRVKILHGSHVEVAEGAVIGRKTQGLAPPIPLRSTSHPDPTRIYNDGFLSVDVSWTKAFPSLQGYYVRLDSSPLSPPTAADGTFQAVDKVSFSPNDVNEGDNYVHVVSVDAQSAIGTVETVFSLQINTQGPSLSSDSHPSQATFTDNTNPFFEWSYPQGDDNVSGAYYVLDQFGTTVPSATDTQVPATQKQLLKSDVPAGVWVLHVVSIDTAGRLSKEAGHYRVNIGTDPGVGAIIGRVVSSTAQAVSGATVSVNRGLYETTTDSLGNFTLTGVTAGTWELSVKMGATSATKSITVIKDQTTPGDMTL